MSLVCFHCAWPKENHVPDSDEQNEEGVKKAYLPLPGALFSLLDCPAFEPDLTGQVLSQKSRRVALDDILAERW